MSERLTNEEMDQQFNDLPLPDEDASWQKMKELLNKDDDDDRIIPPVFLRSCLGWGLFLLVGLGVAWLIVRPEQWWSEKTIAKQTSSPEKKEEQSINDTTSEKNLSSKQNVDNRNEKGKKNTPVKPSNEISEKDVVIVQNGNENISKIKLPVIKKSKKKFLTQVISENGQASQMATQNNIPATDKAVQKDTTKTINKVIIPSIENNQQEDTITAVADPTPILKDTAKKENPEQPQDSIIKKKTNRAQKKFFLAAGIGEQQQIPVAGQTAVPYSSYGRKGSLSDYVPSVFIQLHKEKKWFVQAEFRYGAAQSLKEFSYNRQTKYDTGTKNISVTTMRLKKTYYHQLPFTFNYYFKQNLSVGIGGMYSRFYRAITEKETQTLNVQTQTTSSLKEIIPIRNFTDSFLYKTQLHVLLQADYQWRKFSFGLRYTKDVQPYIKYTKPDGIVDEEKNQSLQLIVRYRIWKSKNF